MGTRIVWQILSIIWLFLALYFGGLNLLVGLSGLQREIVGRGPAGHGWFNVILGAAVLYSGFVACIVAFEQSASVAEVVEQTLLAFALLALPVLGAWASFRGGPSSFSAFSRWWAGSRISVRVILAAIAFAFAIVRDDPISRAILIFVGLLQVALIVMDVVLDRAHRGRE